ncbi:MAG: hypothetical protein JSS36_06360 [Proteobacteria bacterium]|nr:hypothetical protein [Pseudomonadota bacterium]
MADPFVTLAPLTSLTGLAGLAMVTLATFKGWQGWLALKLRELEAHATTPAENAPLGMNSRIEIADLKERIRKLEAIAAGVDL